MQGSGGDIISQYDRLFAAAYPYRNRLIGIRPVGFGGNHQIEFLRQRLLIFNFHFAAELSVRPSPPCFRSRDTAKLLHLFRRAGNVEQEAVGFIANVVIDNLQRIDVALITFHIDKGIFERGFTLPLGFVDALDFLFASQLALRYAPVGGERHFRRPQLTHLVAAVDPDEIITRRKVGQLEAQRCGVFAFRQRLNAFVGDAQQQRQAEMAAGEGDHILL